LGGSPPFLSHSLPQISLPSACLYLPFLRHAKRQVCAMASVDHSSTSAIVGQAHFDESFEGEEKSMWLKKAFIVGVIVLVMGGSGSVSWSGQPGGARVQDIVDLVVLRPVGVVATVAGACLFVLTLPFTVPTRSVDKSAQNFVVAPFNYTFSRPFPDKNL